MTRLPAQEYTARVELLPDGTATAVHVPNTTTEPPDRDAHFKLAKLMEDDLGVRLDGTALRMFILHRWRLVSAYSHAIHDRDGA